MLMSLTLKNFKQHSDIHLDFTRGVNVITGENFAGKSSLLHGILYAWFGSLAVPGGQKIIQKRGTDRHSAEVSWAMGESVYHIKRTSSLCNLWRNGKEDADLVATGATPVATHMIELFGMDRAEFCDIKYSEQKKAEQMLTMGAPRVHALIEKIVDAERVNQVIDRTKREWQNIDTQLEVMPKFNVEELLSTKESLEALTAQHNTVVATLSVQLVDAQARFAVTNNELQSLRTNSALQIQAVSRYFELSRELASVEASFQEAMGKLNNRPVLSPLPDIQRAIAETQARLAGFETATSLWTTYDINHRTALTTLNHYTAKVTQCEGIVAGIPVHKESKDQLRAEDEQLSAERQTVKDELAVAKSHLTHLLSGKENSTCHTCNRPFEGQDIETIESQIAGTTTLVDQLNKKLTEKDERLQVCRTKIVETTNRENAEYDLEGAIQAKQQAQTSMDGVEAPTVSRPSAVLVAQAKEELTKLQQQGRDVEIEAVTLENLRERVSSLVSKRNELSGQLAQLVEQNKLTQEQVTPGNTTRPFQSEIQALEIQYSDLDRQSRTLSEELTRNKEAIALLDGKLANVSEKILAASQSKAETQVLQKRSDLCKKLNKLLRDNKDTFLGEVWARVTSYATLVAQTCTGGKISEVSRTADGKFEYWEDGEVFPVEAASGAQRSIMGLGVQLALSEMLPSPFDALLLDEPTADMSDTVSMSLAALLSKMGSQVLMISHREMDGAVSDNSIHV